MIPRLVAAGAIVLVAVVAAVTLLGGEGGHRHYMEFQSAGRLVEDDDVQVGGRRVGRIEAIELTGDNQARIEIEVHEPFAPLRDGTRGVIRATSLSGREGLEVNDDRHCGRGVPVITRATDPALGQLLGEEIRERTYDLFLPATQNTQQPAPPCKLQAPQTFQGETLQYPHVKPRP